MRQFIYIVCIRILENIRQVSVIAVYCLRIEDIFSICFWEGGYTMKKTHSIHIDDDVYTVLREAQGRQKDKISLRRLLQRYVREGILREKKLSNFDNALAVYFENSEDSTGFKEYLNSSSIGALIRLLDATRPTYHDIALMDATIMVWQIKSREFFKTLLVYARYGFSDLKGE